MKWLYQAIHIDIQTLHRQLWQDSYHWCFVELVIKWTVYIQNRWFVWVNIRVDIMTLNGFNVDISFNQSCFWKFMKIHVLKCKSSIGTQQLIINNGLMMVGKRWSAMQTVIWWQTPKGFLAAWKPTVHILDLWQLVY